MEVGVKTKMLKQSRLMFGQTKKIIEDKENIPMNQQTDETENTVSPFKSIKKQKNVKNETQGLSNGNTVEVTVDVHQTIQCPEISTSSMDSDAEKIADVIDLTEDIEETGPGSKMSEETSKNIDAVIDFVIEQSLKDADSLFSQHKTETKARKRSHSNSSDTPLINLKNSIAKDKANCEENDADGVATKKPRRSILDMLSAAPVIDDKPTVKKVSITLTRCDNNMEVDSEVVDSEETNQDKTCGVEMSPCDKANFSKTDKTQSDKTKVADETIEMINLCNEEDPVESQNKTPNKKDLNCTAGSLQSAKLKKTPSSASKSKTSKKSVESPRLKEEKEKEREEKRKQKEEEKRQREAEKLETKKKKEEERLQREEEKKKKKEEAEKLKEEKLKKKQEELDKKKLDLEAKRVEKEKKDEEKKREKEKKEAEKQAKEEERQKMLDEKNKVEEEKKRKVEKQSKTFKNFFSPARSISTKKRDALPVGSFVPFQLKKDMHLCPRPEPLNSEQKSNLDELLLEQILSSSSSYLRNLSTVKRSLQRTLPEKEARPLSLSEDGVELVAHGKPINLQPKLLQFSENVRPAYYGTWRKKSKKLSPRNPLKQDKDLFDYELDSDDEWEEPAEGEDIANSDGEEEGEKDEDEDDGDGFFVPHGYLSDDEGINEEEEEDDVNEERSDQKLKMKQQEFENSFKQRIKVLVPLTIGCIWDETNSNFSSSHVSELQKYQVEFFIPGPIDLDMPVKVTDDGSKSENKTPASTKKLVPEEAIPDLVRMLHGNPHSLGRLIPEFQEFWNRKTAKDDDDDSSTDPNSGSGCSPLPSLSILGGLQASPFGAQGASEKSRFKISKLQLSKKIREIGVYAKKDNYSRSCWLVLPSVFEKYSLNPEDYPIPCKWEYITFEPDVKLYYCEVPQPPIEPPVTNETPKGNIGKFATKVPAQVLLEKSNMRILQEKEKQQQAMLAVEKFATNKIAPEKLLEASKQKSEIEEAKQKRRISLTTISLPGDRSRSESPNPENEASSSVSGSFGFPTHSAFKSFFKVKEIPPHKKSQIPEDEKEAGDNIEKMDVDSIDELTAKTGSDVAGPSGLQKSCIKTPSPLPVAIQKSDVIMIDDDNDVVDESVTKTDDVDCSSKQKEEIASNVIMVDEEKKNAGTDLVAVAIDVTNDAVNADKQQDKEKPNEIAMDE